MGEKKEEVMEEEKEGVTVAWVSRHLPLMEQIRVLKEKLGEDTTIVPLPKTYKSTDEILKDIEEVNAKYAVLVLPLSMIAQLVKHKHITWLWAEMEALHICDLKECKDFNQDTDTWIALHGETVGRHLRFRRFKIIKEVKLVLEDF